MSLHSVFDLISDDIRSHNFVTDELVPWKMNLFGVYNGLRYVAQRDRINVFKELEGQARLCLDHVLLLDDSEVSHSDFFFYFRCQNFL